MPDIEFRDPWLLMFALAAIIAYLLSARRSGSVQYSSLSIPDAGSASLRLRLTRLPAICLAGSVIFMSIAIAGPRTPDAETKVLREGIAIMMAVDRSSSMNARDLVKDDVSVDRLQVVKEVFEQFVIGDGSAGRGRMDDAIGLVTFAGFADSLCPLTLDHGNLVSMVRDVEIVDRESEDGTALGDGLALAVERLRESPAKSKVAILLTDGVHNAGIITPIQAAEIAEANQIRVYCIGTGTNGTAPVPAINSFTGQTVLQRMRVEIDE